MVFRAREGSKSGSKDPDHRGFSGIFDLIGLSKTAQNQ